MPIERLDKLQYSLERAGPFQLYIYGANGYHSGGQWFNKKTRYSDEYILIPEAKKRADAAIAEGKEVRIVDAGDLLVFHSQNGTILYPAPPADFWAEIQ